MNRRLAEIIARHTAEDDHIWVHDYHLITVGQELRALRAAAEIGYSSCTFRFRPWIFS